MMNVTKTSESIPNFRSCSLYEWTHESVTHFPSEKHTINQIMVSCFDGFLAFLTVALNSIAIATISKCTQLKEKLCYFLVLVQSGVDLLVGVVSLPLLTFVLTSELKEDTNCTVNVLAITFSFYFVGCSVITLSAITMERYMGIIHPVMHRTKLTKKKLFSFISLAQFVYLLGTCTSFVYKVVSEKVIGIFLVLFLSKVIYVYTRIFMVARKKSPTLIRPNETAVGQNKANNLRNKARLQEIKLAKSCFAMVLLFLICYLPMSVLAILFRDKLTVVQWRIVHSWCVTIVMLNSSLNSVVFFWIRPILRKEANKILSKMCGSSQHYSSIDIISLAQRRRP